MNRRKIMSAFMLIVMFLTYVSPLSESVVNIISYQIEASENETNFTFDETSGYADVEMENDGTATLSNYEAEGYTYYANGSEIDPTSTISLPAGDNTLSVEAEDENDIDALSNLRYELEDSIESEASDSEETSETEASASDSEETSETEDTASDSEESSEKEATASDSEESSETVEGSTEIETTKTTGGFCDFMTADDYNVPCNVNQIIFENSSFEEPVLTSNVLTTHEDNIPGWRTTADDQLIEIQTLDAGLVSPEKQQVDGNQYAEINANQGDAALFQDFDTIPGESYYYSIWVGGRMNVGNDMSVRIGEPADFEGLYGSPNRPTEGGTSDNVFNSPIYSGEWIEVTGKYTVPEGQTVTRVAFLSNKKSSTGNLVDNVRFNTEAVYDMETTLTQKGNAFNVSTTLNHNEYTDYFGTNDLVISTKNLDTASLSKSDISVTDQYGEELDFTASFGNNQVTISDIDSTGQVYINFDADYIQSDSSDIYTVTANARFTYMSAIEEADSGTADLYYVRDAASAEVSGILDVEKSLYGEKLENGYADNGEELTYLIKVTNNSKNNTFKTVTVNDYPDDDTYGSVYELNIYRDEAMTDPVTDKSIAGNQITINEELAVGESFYITYKVGAVQSYTNNNDLTNTMSASYTDSYGSDKHIVVGDFTEEIPKFDHELEVTKTADKTEVMAGDTITYTISISNQSDKAETDVRVVDLMDDANLVGDTVITRVQ